MSTTNGLSPRVLDTLQRLGLTEYGARCYASLVALGEAEASAIADAADVPRTKVYGVLKDLVDSGWVASRGGRPVRYVAASPDERVRDAEKAIADDAATAVRELQARREMGAQMVPMSMYLLKGAPLITRKSLELVTRARRELLVMLGFTLPEEARALADALEAARRRGIVVRLLVPAHPLFGPIEGIEHFRGLLRDARQSPFPFRAVIADFKQAVITIPQPGVAPADVTGFWNPTEAFVQALSPVLRAAWDSAPAHEEGLQGR